MLYALPQEIFTLVTYGLRSILILRALRMSALANVFISIRHSSFFLGALWLALFLGFLAVGYCFVLLQVVGEVRRDHDAELGRIADTRRSAMSALRMLKHDATGSPCSSDFLAQMRRVAFLPDGLNEFLYAPNGVVKCSTSQSAFATRVTARARLTSRAANQMFQVCGSIAIWDP